LSISNNKSAMENRALIIRELVIAESSGTITQKEKEFLDELRDEHPEIKAFSDDIYQVLAPIREKSFKKDNPPIDEIFKLAKKMQSAERTKIFKLTGRIAACMIGCCVIGALFYYHNSKRKSSSLLAQKSKAYLLIGGRRIDLNGKDGVVGSNGELLLNNTKEKLVLGKKPEDSICKLVVPAAKDFNIQLSDGSIVSLNPASSMEFPLKFPSHTRTIKIEGEAYLNIKSDPSKPLEVMLPNCKLQVLGTEFNVSTYNKNESIISLVRGRLNVKDDHHLTKLDPGQQAFSNGKITTVRPFNKDSLLNWKNGLINIDNVAIETIPSMVSRYFGEKLVIDESAQGIITMVAFDRHKTVDAFLNTYCQANEQYQLKSYKTGNVYHLKSLRSDTNIL